MSRTVSKQSNNGLTRTPKSSKLKNTLRRIIPLAVIAPFAAWGTIGAVDYVSSPLNLYPTTKSASSKALVIKENQVNRALAQVTTQLNSTSKQLAQIANNSASGEQSLSQINNAISSIKNTPVPQLGASANPVPISPSSGASSGVKSSATSPPSQIIQIPVQNAPAATTRASQLG